MAKSNDFSTELASIKTELASRQRDLIRLVDRLRKEDPSFAARYVSSDMEKRIEGWRMELAQGAQAKAQARVEKMIDLFTKRIESIDNHGRY